MAAAGRESMYYRKARNPFTPIVPLHAIHSGKEYTCSHSGISQYSEGGTAACGLAALNCARIVLDLERNGIQGDDLIVALLEKRTMHEIMSICSYWPSNAHFELEDIYRTPLFETSLRLLLTGYEKPDYSVFSGMLSELERHGDPRQSCAVVLTRPPEIIACLKLRNPRQPVYVIFDSHPRPGHPDGAAFVFFTSHEMAARYITELLPVDEKLASDSELQWEVQLLANMSAHLFQAGERDLNNTGDALRTLFEANFGLLRLKVEGENTQTRCKAVITENEKLQKTMRELETELRTLKQQNALLSKRIEEGRSEGKSSSSDYKGKGKATEKSEVTGHTRWPFSYASEAFSSFRDWSYGKSYKETTPSDPGPSGTHRDEEKEKQKEVDAEMALRAQIHELKMADFKADAQAASTPKRTKVDLFPERRAPGGAYGSGTRKSRSKYSEVLIEPKSAKDTERTDQEIAFRTQVELAKMDSIHTECDANDTQGDEELARQIQEQIAKEESKRPTYDLRTRNRSNYDAGYYAGRYSGSGHKDASTKSGYTVDKYYSRVGQGTNRHSDAYADFLAKSRMKIGSSASSAYRTDKRYERAGRRDSGSRRDSVFSKRSPSPKRTSQSERDLDLELAMRLQLDYNNEDMLLRAQLTELQANAQVTFACTICMEDIPEDSIARVDGCKHSFCRECLRGHVVAQISENNYPIQCPICTTEKDRQKVEVVTEELIRQLGLEEKDFTKFDEMQMIHLSVPVECRKCNRAMFIDRNEFEETQVLTCPLPDCAYSWCKACQQPAAPNSNPPHSCDGTNELDHLIGERGWKRCPGCGTPTERTFGCDHMACRAPGCNVHFCYKCGGDLKGAYSHNC